MQNIRFRQIVKIWVSVDLYYLYTIRPWALVDGGGGGDVEAGAHVGDAGHEDGGAAAAAAEVVLLIRCLKVILSRRDLEEMVKEGVVMKDDTANIG